MGTLTYSMIVSLDGYFEDGEGDFDWAEPSPQMHAFVNDRERHVDTYLYGRRMFRMLECWETDPALAEQSDEMRDFAQIWCGADKIVYSTTLSEPATSRTRIERAFDPDEVRRLKPHRTMTIGGADLAGHALAAGIVDEIELYVVPVVVGRGRRVLPDGYAAGLTLLEHHGFDDGAIYLHYRVEGGRTLGS
ncbi:MAG: dihydrofolate reductase family protein [Tomitella sp.]|nr:dihydrofolate reductase family protein [Tomitella sp.]